MFSTYMRSQESQGDHVGSPNPEEASQPRDGSNANETNHSDVNAVRLKLDALSPMGPLPGVHLNMSGRHDSRNSSFGRGPSAFWTGPLPSNGGADSFRPLHSFYHHANIHETSWRGNPSPTFVPPDASLRMLVDPLMPGPLSVRVLEHSDAPIDITRQSSIRFPPWPEELNENTPASETPWSMQRHATLPSPSGYDFSSMRHLTVVESPRTNMNTMAAVTEEDDNHHRGDDTENIEQPRIKETETNHRSKSKSKCSPETYKEAKRREKLQAGPPTEQMLAARTKMIRRKKLLPEYQRFKELPFCASTDFPVTPKCDLPCTQRLYAEQINDWMDGVRTYVNSQSEEGSTTQRR